jgi:cellulose synthase (UDP-forming)
MTMGWMMRDPKLAMLQTPHHFYSPDPFERNLGQFRVTPNEGELFYGIVQDGNDFWNATYFCGSCAVLRRTALDEIGGIAVETVTEDAHTSLRMQMNGWGTAYINIPQAAGLATERLSAHVGQRIRWARGMIQILRTDNPLFAPGLKFPQRLCYFNAMAHFLYAVPRLIFLSAPLIYLLLNHTNIPGYWAAILAYALPHLVLSNLTNSRIQGEHRHSFWNEIYETVLSPYILLPTMMALISPKLGKFNVTSKGGVVKQTFFDAKIAQPFIILLVLNLAGLLVAIPRFFIWDRDRPGTVLMNVLWCAFNVVIIGVCIAVAREMRQLRTSVRINVVTPVLVRLPGGRPITAETYDALTSAETRLPDVRPISGETIDMSSGGTSIRFAKTWI